MKMAQNHQKHRMILRHSISIAEYLCFSSQSYFGKMFKEKNEISPAEYRRRNRVTDFKSEE